MFLKCSDTGRLDLWHSRKSLIKAGGSPVRGNTWFCFLSSPLLRVIIWNQRHRKSRARQQILLNSKQNTCSFIEKRSCISRQIYCWHWQWRKGENICLGNCFPLIFCSMDGSTCLLFYEKKWWPRNNLAGKSRTEFGLLLITTFLNFLLLFSQQRNCKMIIMYSR